MIGEIRKIQKLNRSKFGNPNYRLWILTKDGLMILRTKSNIMDSYAITSGWVNSMVEFEIDKNNKIISIERNQGK